MANKSLIFFLVCLDVVLQKNIYYICLPYLWSKTKLSNLILSILIVFYFMKYIHFLLTSVAHMNHFWSNVNVCIVDQYNLFNSVISVVITPVIMKAFARCYCFMRFIRSKLHTPAHVCLSCFNYITSIMITFFKLILNRISISRTHFRTIN